MIRRATIDDIDDCVDLTIEFFGSFLSKHGIPILESDVRDVAKTYILNDQMLVIERDGLVLGITAWAIVPHPANRYAKIFYEMIWCVKSECKTDVLALLRAIEKEANKSDVDMIVMANLATESESQLKRIFEKRGYEFLETHYNKVIRR